MKPAAETCGEFEDTVVGNENDNVAGGIEHCRANLAGLKVAFDALAQFGVQLVVNVRRDVLPDVFAIDSHARHPNSPACFGANGFSFGARTRCNIARARCSLTLTAPSLIPSTAAVSRPSISSMSLSSITLR